MEPTHTFLGRAPGSSGPHPALLRRPAGPKGYDPAGWSDHAVKGPLTEATRTSSRAHHKGSVNPPCGMGF